MDFLELFLLTPGQVIDLINSNIFYVYAVPIFLILESGITYLYLKKIKTYKSVAEKKNTAMTFWAYMIIKMFFFGPGYPTIYSAVQRGDFWNISSKYMIIYYLYSLGLCVAFGVYLANKIASLFSIANQQSGEKSTPESVIEDAVLYDVSEPVQRIYDCIPPSGIYSLRGVVLYLILLVLAVITGIVYLISGGLDKYFGVNKTADYHELGKTLHNIDLWVRYGLLAMLGLSLLPIVFFILRKHRKADLERLSSAKREAAPETSEPQPDA